MSQQWSDEEKIKRSQFVIQNDEDDAVLPQALDIHEKILQLSRERFQSSHHTIKS
jgi:hypothetical protein